MAGKTTTDRIHQQKRRVNVRRIEIVLNPTYPEDQVAIDYLDSLPYGTKSDFMREAVVSEIDHQINPPPDYDELRSMLADALARLEDLQSREVVVEQVQMQRVTIAPPSDTSQTASSGIDMSRSRPRKKLGRTQAQIEAPELSDAEQIRLGQEMAKSIRKAQPGRH